MSRDTTITFGLVDSCYVIDHLLPYFIDCDTGSTVVNNLYIIMPIAHVAVG